MHACYGSSLAPPPFQKNHSTPKPSSTLAPWPYRRQRPATVCRVASSSSSITDLDLYDLLGIDSSSDQLEIKNAYRGLQKRCHPDIAGPAGHDMAIVLNEVYSLLSDPISRSAYDKELAKMSNLRGYTGKPLYSVWMGPESEQRAIFVDEVRCVGCLKCALLAGNTFAIESVYGRARAIKQWADPEHQILDAIRTCPVDCISFVERADLPALEFLMSKQPRSGVSMATGGNRVSSNIFKEIDKFQRKFQETNDSKKHRQQGDPHSDARFSAVQGIKFMTKWLYWRTPAAARGGEARRPLMLLPVASDRNTSGRKPNIEKLREAAAKMRAVEGWTRSSWRNSGGHREEEYWTPKLVLAPPLESGSGVVGVGNEGHSMRYRKVDKSGIHVKKEVELLDPVSMRIPTVVGLVSAIVVGCTGDHSIGNGLGEHVGGRVVAEVVNSFELQVLLAGITWYLCAAAGVGLIRGIWSRVGSKRF